MLLLAGAALELARRAGAPSDARKTLASSRLRPWLLPGLEGKVTLAARWLEGRDEVGSVGLS